MIAFRLYVPRKPVVQLWPKVSPFCFLVIDFLLSVLPSFGPVSPVHESVCHPSPDGSMAETNL